MALFEFSAVSAVNRSCRKSRFDEMLQLEQFSLIPIEELDIIDENTW